MAIQFCSFVRKRTNVLGSKAKRNERRVHWYEKRGSSLLERERERDRGRDRKTEEEKGKEREKKKEKERKKEKEGREERNTSGTNNAIHVVSFQHQKNNFPIGTMLHTQNCSRTVWVQLKKQLSWKDSIGGTNEVKFDEKEERQIQTNGRKKKGKNMTGRLSLYFYLSRSLSLSLSWSFFSFGNSILELVFLSRLSILLSLSLSLITILASSSN